MLEKNLYLINQNIVKACKTFDRKVEDVNIVAVSKTIASEKIIEAINLGCKIFGENYIQEAKQKWVDLRKKYPQIKLNFIGHLQSNKAKEAVELFDCIETVDNEKLAREIAKAQKKLQKNCEIFIQVNIGDEPQKSGIAIENLSSFINHCKNDLELNVVGLMAIPPSNENASPYFALLAKLAYENNLTKLSMGMSSDYEDAIALNATHIRLGTAIFGARVSNAQS
jgi:pyridoxal phosphate enzyme (YggS family)